MRVSHTNKWIVCGTRERSFRAREVRFEPSFGTPPVVRSPQFLRLLVGRNGASVGVTCSHRRLVLLCLFLHPSQVGNLVATTTRPATGISKAMATCNCSSYLGCDLQDSVHDECIIITWNNSRHTVHKSCVHLETFSVRGRSYSGRRFLNNGMENFGIHHPAELGACHIPAW